MSPNAISAPPLTRPRLLRCSGRTGNTERLALRNIGLQPDSRGQLSVNRRYETAIPGVYAAGDVTGVTQGLGITFNATLVALTLAICFGEAQVVAVEPRKLRATFVAEAAAALQLGNLQTIAASLHSAALRRHRPSCPPTFSRWRAPPHSPTKPPYRRSS